jgi:hypothetical protein
MESLYSNPLDILSASLGLDEIKGEIEVYNEIQNPGEAREASEIDGFVNQLIGAVEAIRADVKELKNRVGPVSVDGPVETKPASDVTQSASSPLGRQLRDEVDKLRELDALVIETIQLLRI